MSIDWKRNKIDRNWAKKIPHSFNRLNWIRIILFWPLSLRFLLEKLYFQISFSISFRALTLTTVWEELWSNFLPAREKKQFPMRVESVEITTEITLLGTFNSGVRDFNCLCFTLQQIALPDLRLFWRIIHRQESLITTQTIKKIAWIVSWKKRFPPRGWNGSSSSTLNLLFNIKHFFFVISPCGWWAEIQRAKSVIKS